jgi:hypothetical protein
MHDGLFKSKEPSIAGFLSAGMRSDCIRQAKAEVSTHLTAYLSKNSLSKDDGWSLCHCLYS